MTVGERFDMALQEILGYARYGAGLSREYNVSAQAISQLKKKEKTSDLMRKIAKDKGISLPWLEFGEGEMLANKNDVSTCNQPINSTSIVNDSGSMYQKSHYVEIPYYKDVYASAGGGSDRTDGSVRSPVSFSRAFLNSYLGVYNLNGISIINAAGDSMEPTIKSGELMFVSSMELEEFKDGGIYVIMCGDVLMVKRVTYDPLTGEYTLVSDNGKVAPVKLRMDEADGCRFVGRVVGHMDRV